jgi:hypothetical protein
MNTPTLTRGIHLSRRAFLGGVGATISLPLLDAMTPALRATNARSPRRFVAMCAGLGFHTPYLFPEQTGRNYALTPYLETMKNHRNDFTVLSGLSHPEQNGNNGHASEMTWLTSAKRPGLAGFKNSVSIDQLISDQIGVQTRFPNLVLSNGGNSMSWTSTGVAIPAQRSPAKLFSQLFIEGTPQEKEEQARQIQRGRSILDTVLGEAKSLRRDLDHRDQEKLDEYLGSVRDLETRLQQSEGWTHKPKPKVETKPPRDITDRAEIIAQTRLMYDLIALALQTDSTRTVTYGLGGLNSPPKIPGVSTDWHQLSHHGRDETKIAELKLIELAEFQALNDFITKLKTTKENGGSLLDNSMILFGSNLGNASSHSWRNLPLVLAGGGFKHGQHIAHDEKNNVHFANLLVQMARQMNVEIDQFGSSDAEDIRGLENA